MKPASMYERATLGLRQTISDVECAESHLDMVLSAADEHIQGITKEIEDIHQHLCQVLVQLEQCQRQVYRQWHASLPPLNYGNQVNAEEKSCAPEISS